MTRRNVEWGYLCGGKEQRSGQRGSLGCNTTRSDSDCAVEKPSTAGHCEANDSSLRLKASVGCPVRPHPTSQPCLALPPLASPPHTRLLPAQVKLRGEWISSLMVKQEEKEGGRKGSRQGGRERGTEEVEEEDLGGRERRRPDSEGVRETGKETRREGGREGGKEGDSGSRNSREGGNLFFRSCLAVSLILLVSIVAPSAPAALPDLTMKKRKQATPPPPLPTLHTTHITREQKNKSLGKNKEDGKDKGKCIVVRGTGVIN
ncbi:hypothetical protein E2C01_058911 [Portunus trituberculatus]|uniref:Uncharacterized protein n=1 Tax=Portunus trituberculatus TaxID=210409 RepID=A0A5B7GXM9_PORTR|nr:hypothetical protein [Portunus trituberculatus]